MKNKRYILIIFFVLTIVKIFAFQDFVITKDYGNIKVRITSGYCYEEINKVFIIGELAKILSSQLDYKDQIFLDFDHNYTGDCEPDYFISFNKGDIEYTWSGAYKPNPPLHRNSIVIRQVSRYFNVKSTLKLLEYAVKNISIVKLDQKYIEYKQNYCQWKIQTIDTLKINEVLMSPISERIKAVMKTKIERPVEKIIYGVSYYWENDTYTVFLRDSDKEDIEIQKLENIYFFKKIDDYSAIIFDTDSSFYVAYLYVEYDAFLDSDGQIKLVDKFKHKNISTRNIILNTHDYYAPYKVESIGGNKLSIFFSYNLYQNRLSTIDRTLIYLIDKDYLIQDLDFLIEKNK